MGLIKDILFSTCSAIETPSTSDLWAAYGFGMDDGDWCRINDHDADVPTHYIHPDIINEWHKGYKLTRGKETKK